MVDQSIVTTSILGMLTSRGTSVSSSCWVPKILAFLAPSPTLLGSSWGRTVVERILSTSIGRVTVVTVSKAMALLSWEVEVLAMLAPSPSFLSNISFVVVNGVISTLWAIMGVTGSRASASSCSTEEQRGTVTAPSPVVLRHCCWVEWSRKDKNCCGTWEFYLSRPPINLQLQNLVCCQIFCQNFGGFWSIDICSYGPKSYCIFIKLEWGLSKVLAQLEGFRESLLFFFMNSLWHFGKESTFCPIEIFCCATSFFGPLQSWETLMGPTRCFDHFPWNSRKIWILLAVGFWRQTEQDNGKKCQCKWISLLFFCRFTRWALGPIKYGSIKVIFYVISSSFPTPTTSILRTCACLWWS